MLVIHSSEIWQTHPTLVAGILYAHGIDASAEVGDRLRPHREAACRRLETHPVSDLPEIQAWRRGFAAMGLKPTQYRCASEALLRRLGKDGHLPRIHPLIDLCNHVSARYAIPVGVFDRDFVAGDMHIREAVGDEEHVTFGGSLEHPAPGEVVFADDAGRVHSRRWTNRQGAHAAVRASTQRGLIVVEALHQGAVTDVAAVLETLSREITAIWGAEPHSHLVLGPNHPIRWEEMG